MMKSALYVLLLVSLVKAVPNPYLESLSGWFLYPSNSEKEEIPKQKLRSVVDEFSSEPDKNVKNSKNEATKFDTYETKNEPLHRVVNADDDNENVKVVNPDNPIPVDALLDEMNENVNASDEAEKREMVNTLKDLRNKIYDNSIRKANVLVKGIWRAVDFGIVGSSQRTRAAQRTEGFLASVFDFLKGIGHWFGEMFDHILGKDETHDEDDKHIDESESDKEKEKDKDKDKGEKDGKKSSIHNFDDTNDGDGGKSKNSRLQEDDSHDSSRKMESPEVVLKPSSVKHEDEDETHMLSNGEHNFDPNHPDNFNDESLVPDILDIRLKTREDVDKALKKAQQNKDFKNKYFIQSKKAEKYRQKEKDDRVWTEAEALNELERMDKEFGKADNTSMAKDLLSLSLQPLFYVETYDKMLAMNERLAASGGDKNMLQKAEDYALKQKFFSLENSIMKTSKKTYRANQRKIHEDFSKTEKEKHGESHDWTDDEANHRMDLMLKNFEEKPDNTYVVNDVPNMVKEITSMALQPFLKLETYERMYTIIDDLVNEAEVSEDKLKVADDSIILQARFSYVDSILEKAEMLEEKLHMHSQKAAEKRKKMGDIPEFTEEEAKEMIEDMNTHYDSKDDKHSMVKDVTNLSVQSLYHVETYDKISHLIEKLKADGVHESELKPAIDSLAEKRAFSSSITSNSQEPLAQKLENLKREYITHEPLSKEKKLQLFNELQILRKQQELTVDEAKDAYDLLQVLMKGDLASNGLDPSAVGEMYQLVDDLKKRHLQKLAIQHYVQLSEWQMGKIVDGNKIAFDK